MLLPGIQNWPHLHLVTNHIPIIGLGLVLVWLVWGILTRDPAVERAGYLMLILVALGTVVVFVSGHQASTRSEVMMARWFNQTLIETHEERAHLACYITWAAGLLALIGFGMGMAKRVVPRWLAGLILASTLLGAGAMVWVADAGGKIHHEEIRSPTHG